MKRENLPVYFNLPIDASLANFSKNYNDIICINTSTIISNYTIFQKIEPFDAPNSTPSITKDSFDIPNIETPSIESVSLFDKYQGVISAKSFIKDDAPNPEAVKNIQEIQNSDIPVKAFTNSEEKSIDNKSKNIIETNDEVRKTYELYEKMFNEGTFGKSAVPEVPSIAINPTAFDIPKPETTNKLDAKQTFEMYEKMFAEGTFEDTARTDTTVKTTEESTNEKSEARATFEMYEKMFAEGTFDDTTKTETTVKPTEEPTSEKSEARATFEMYEKMFAEGTFDDASKTESTVKTIQEPTNEKSEARATFEMYEKMFAEGTFDDTAKTESTVKTTEEPTNEKSEARATFEMYEKMFAEGTFEDTPKTETTIKTTEEPTSEKSEARATFEMYEKMFAEGTFNDTTKTESTVKTTEEPTNEKSEARATFEMYEKMFAEGTFEEPSKTDSNIVDLPKVQNIFEAIPNPLDVLNQESDRENQDIENKISTANQKDNTIYFENKTSDLPLHSNIDEQSIDLKNDNTMFTDFNKKIGTSVGNGNPTTDDEKEKARQTYEFYEKKFNEGSFETNDNFKSVKFSKEILKEDSTTESSNQSIEAFEKINNFFTNVTSSTPTSDKVNPSEPNLSNDPNNIFSIYNLDHKEDNYSFFLKFDHEHGALNEWIEEHGDNIFKLKKITADTYHFEMIENDVNHHFFVKKGNLVLDFCEILNSRHGSHSKIKTIRTGKIVKEDNKWVIKDKAKTMYQ